MVAMARAFLDIHRVRMGSRLQYDIEVPQALRSQPYVEQGHFTLISPYVVREFEGYTELSTSPLLTGDWTCTSCEFSFGAERDGLRALVLERYAFEDGAFSGIQQAMTIARAATAKSGSAMTRTPSSFDISRAKRAAFSGLRSTA